MRQFAALKLEDPDDSPPFPQCAATPKPVDYLAIPPVVLAYGIGVDSTALLVELEARGEIPDLVLTKLAITKR